MIKNILFFLVLTTCLAASSDGPTYRLLPGDGYQWPSRIKGELKRKRIPLSEMPEEIVAHMDRVVDDTLSCAEYEKIAPDYDKGFPVLEIDLNFDGIPEWLVMDRRGAGATGNAVSFIYQKKNGVWETIGSYPGSVPYFYEKRNGYLQIEGYVKSNMIDYGFFLLAYSPETGEYKCVRSEWYCYNTNYKDRPNFTCSIGIGRLDTATSEDAIHARLEHFIRSTAYRLYDEQFDQESLELKDNTWTCQKKDFGFAIKLLKKEEKYTPSFDVAFQKRIALDQPTVKGMVIGIFGSKKASELCEAISLELDKNRSSLLKLD